MKFVLTILLTTLITYGQKPSKSKSVDNPHEIISDFKKKIDQKWIRQNPELSINKTSFFNKNNESKYYIGNLQISGKGQPFTWDDNLSFLTFLLTLDNKTTIKHGIYADKIYKGTKIAWTKNINGLIWFNKNTYKVSIDNWYLFGINDCTGNIIFPNVSFKKFIKIPNVISNNIEGLTIVPYIENIKIKSVKTFVKTKNGKTLNGIGYDLNNDSILDIFSYDETIDETTIYTRLYINVDGKWKCKWVNLNEECI